MLNLTWMPTALRYCSGADNRQFRLPSCRSSSASGYASDSGGCLGRCTAPSPVSSQQNAPNAPGCGSFGATTGSGASGNLAALLSAAHSAAAAVAAGVPAVIGDDDFCAYCQDVCWWFELASQLCHHLAPPSPPALPRLELSVTAISGFLTKPGEQFPGFLYTSQFIDIVWKMFRSLTENDFPSAIPFFIPFHNCLSLPLQLSPVGRNVPLYSLLHQ